LTSILHTDKQLLNRLRLTVFDIFEFDFIMNCSNFLHLPVELLVKDTTVSPNPASYLDLYIEHDIYGTLTTKLYDKRDDFNFPIVKYPFLGSKIPSSPAHGVYLSQLI